MASTNDILKGRFIKRVFADTAIDLEKAISNEITTRGFENPAWGDRTFTVSDSALSYQHLGRHRFVDMRTRNTKEGKKRKKNHPIHNRIIFGHYNNIIRELKYGFTEAVIEELKTIK